MGSMFGLFKNWQFHFMGNMINYAGLGFKNNVWSPLLWQGGAALALGGLGATPLKMVADGIARWNTDAPDSFTWMQENWHDSADEVYFGLPAFLGVSLQASSTLPGTDVRNDTSSLFSFVLLSRAQAIGKAIGAASTFQGATGENALMNPNVRDQLLAALAPRAVFKAASVMEGDYVRSMSTGYPTVRGISPMGRVLTGMGLNSTEVEEYTVVGKSLYKDQEAKRELVQGLGDGYAQAQLGGDQEEMARIIRRTQVLHIPLSSVMKSAQTRVRREEESNVLSRYDKQAVARAVAALQGQ